MCVCVYDGDDDGGRRGGGSGLCRQHGLAGEGMDPCNVGRKAGDLVPVLIWSAWGAPVVRCFGVGLRRHRRPWKRLTPQHASVRSQHAGTHDQQIMRPGSRVMSILCHGSGHGSAYWRAWCGACSGASSSKQRATRSCGPHRCTDASKRGVN